MERKIKIYSARVVDKKTGDERFKLGFYKTKKCLRKYITKILIDLQETPDDVYVEIVTDHLISF